MHVETLMLVLWLCCRALAAQAPEREGGIERRVIAAGQDAEEWEAEEATMSASREHVKAGTAALHFHVDVDYHAGEKEYPIGWPRAARPLKDQSLQDWSRFDFLRFRAFTETSREKLPATPLGLVLYSPDKSQSWEQPLTGLKKGEWVEVEIPIWKIPQHEEVTRFQFFLSESDYKDRDSVDFYISDIWLERYLEPRLFDLAIRPTVLFSDEGHLIASFRALGIPPEGTAAVRLALLSAGKEMQSMTTTVQSGLNEVALDLNGRALAEGIYAARVQLGDAPAEERSVRVVESPWREQGGD